MQIKNIENDLKKRKIKHLVIWNSIHTKWFDPGKVYKRGRDKAGIVKNFRACLMPCVSFLDGKVFVCPIASSLSRLNGEDEFQGDFVRLDSENITQNRTQILKFYKQDFFKACDYCHDMWEPMTMITPAVQLDGVLSVQKND